MGWVCYKKGRFGQALEYIERAQRLSEAPSGEGLEHLGDVHYRLGQTERATQAWQKGLEAERAGDQPSAGRLKRLQKKLEMIKSGESVPVAWSIVDSGPERAERADN
jgi:Tfp pilus assembly protein PilF